MFDRYLMKVTDSSRTGGYRWALWTTTGISNQSANDLRAIADEIDRRNGEGAYESETLRLTIAKSGPRLNGEEIPDFYEFTRFSVSNEGVCQITIRQVTQAGCVDTSYEGKAAGVTASTQVFYIKPISVNRKRREGDPRLAVQGFNHVDS